MSSDLTDADIRILKKHNFNINDTSLAPYLGLIAEQFHKEEDRKKNRSFTEMFSESTTISRPKLKRPTRKTKKVRKLVKSIPSFKRSNKKQNTEDRRKQQRGLIHLKNRNKFSQERHHSDDLVDWLSNMKIKGGVCKGCGGVKLH